MGCLVTYPTIFITLGLVLIFWYPLTEIIGWFALPVGIGLLLTKLIQTKNKKIKALICIQTGIGSILAIFGILSLPINYYLRVIILIVFIMGTGCLAGYKFERVLRTCDSDCEFARDWSRCPGLGEIYTKIYWKLNNEKSKN